MGAKWITVNYQQAARYLLYVYNNYNRYKEPIRKLAIANSGKFSLDSMTKAFRRY